MYEYIKGEVIDLTPAYVVVEAAGIGYYINISLSTYKFITDLKEVKLFVHQYSVRDDLPIMFGFFTQSERALFRMLIAVSGVGGNTARTILSTFTVSELKDIISGGNSRILKNVKGLGAKTSEKVIVELRDKVLSVDASDIDGRENSNFSASNVDEKMYDEALSALVMLGFSKAASAKVVRTVISEHPDKGIEDIIRLALKKL